MIFSRFAIAVLLNDRQFPAGIASSKREASIQAAYQALYQLSLSTRLTPVNHFGFNEEDFLCLFFRRNYLLMIAHYSIVLLQKFSRYMEIYVLVYD